MKVDMIEYIKKIGLTTFFLAFLGMMLFVAPTTYAQSITPTLTPEQTETDENTQNEDEIEIDFEKVDYELPYPGILPDNPLYFVKTTRDSLMVFLTRDNSKKAELLLHLSDKYASIAMTLSEDGHWSTSAEAMMRSEKAFTELITAMQDSEEQGVTPNEDFVDDVAKSNLKHKEIISDLMKVSPNGTRAVLEDVLDLALQSSIVLREFL